MEYKINLVIGLGEIGSAVKKVLSPTHTVYVKDLEDGSFKQRIEIMHICFPYSDTFVRDVANYIEQYDPMLTIVYSTLPVGTCESISTMIVHSPVEGRHPKLAESMRLMPRWLGCADKDRLEMASLFWAPMNPIIRTMGSSRFTEFLKLRSTAKYGVNLVWTDYEAQVAESLGMSFEAVKAFDSDYNHLYQMLGLPEYQRYILDPPGGKIGGHCVVPNAELLNKQYPHSMLDEVIAMEEK